MIEIKFTSYKLPNPYTYQKYQTLNPEVLDRWLRLAEQEQQHRHKINEAILKKIFEVVDLK